MRGTVPKGASKASGLQEGCNWNLELTNILAPGFRRWAESNSHTMKKMCNELAEAMNGLYDQSILILDKSAANFLIVDRARNRWRSYRNNFQVRARTLMDQIGKLEKRTQTWATIEAGQENNLIASITDEIYDAVFISVPPLKESTSKKALRSKHPHYTVPKIKYKKSELERLMISEDNHIVFNKDMEELLTQLFTDIGKLLENYSIWLRAQAPISYPITPVGTAIRDNLQQLIPTLERRSQELKDLFADLPKQETHSSQGMPNFFGDSETRDMADLPGSRRLKATKLAPDYQRAKNGHYRTQIRL